MRRQLLNLKENVTLLDNVNLPTSFSSQEDISYG